MIVNVWLRGCDDSTSFNMKIENEIELKLLDELVRLSHETSEYPCMPDFDYQILEEINELNSDN